MIDAQPAEADDTVAEPQQGVGPLLPGAQREARPLRQQILEHVRAHGRTARADISRALYLYGVTALLTFGLAALLVLARFMT